VSSVDSPFRVREIATSIHEAVKSFRGARIVGIHCFLGSARLRAFGTGVAAAG